jgi:hypothetical protein
MEGKRSRFLIGCKLQFLSHRKTEQNRSRTQNASAKEGAEIDPLSVKVDYNLFAKDFFCKPPT